MREFLIVYETLWHNKFSVKSKIGRLGFDIEKLIDYHENDWYCELDIDKLNSQIPYDVGTFGLGFYDKEVVAKDTEEYLGRIMIFEWI